MELRKKGDKIGELRAPIEEKDRTTAALQEQVKAHGAEIDTLKHQMRVVLQNQSLVSVREAVCTMFDDARSGGTGRVDQERGEARDCRSPRDLGRLVTVQEAHVAC